MRKNYSMIDRFANKGRYYNSAVPCYRKFVVPGQKIDTAEFKTRFQSVETSNLFMTNVVMSTHYFYVPIRLIWDEWVDFIAQDPDVTVTIPTTTTGESAIWQKPGSHALARRAFKLAYNQFFGDENLREAQGDTWYDDITADTPYTVNPVKNLEQFYSKWIEAEDIDAYSVDTFDNAGTPAIDLQDFSRAMGAARAGFKANTTGDKYVDVLRRMGINPDWRIQMAPEHLGTKSADIAPNYTSDTGTDLGKSVTKYVGEVTNVIRNKMFAEHGFIVGFMVPRAITFNDDKYPIDTALTEGIKNFWNGDQKSIETNMGSFQSAASTTMVGAPSVISATGEHVVSNTNDQNYLSTYSQPNFAPALYNQYEMPGLPDPNPLGGFWSYQYLTTGRTRGLTPVSQEIKF